MTRKSTRIPPLGLRFSLRYNFGADVTIVEEGTEFVIASPKPRSTAAHHELLPAWVDFMEKYTTMSCRIFILQIASPDRRRSGQDLLREEEKT
jgi:hypothetical protein